VLINYATEFRTRVPHKVMTFWAQFFWN
jgi:hypothetical protein